MFKTQRLRIQPESQRKEFWVRRFKGNKVSVGFYLNHAVSGQKSAEEQESSRSSSTPSRIICWVDYLNRMIKFSITGMGQCDTTDLMYSCQKPGSNHEGKIKQTQIEGVFSKTAGIYSLKMSTSWKMKTELRNSYRMKKPNRQETRMQGVDRTADQRTLTYGLNIR